MRRKERDTAQEGNTPVFGKLFFQWGLVFLDDQIVGSIDLRRRKIYILHIGHTGTSKMLTEAEMYWMPGMRKDKNQRLQRLPCYKYDS